MPKYQTARHCKHSAEYACRDCQYLFDGEDAFPYEPLGYRLDDGEYRAEQTDTDVFVTHSPFYTFGPFCGPCAPGAVYLRDGHAGPEGAKAYFQCIMKGRTVLRQRNIPR